jgi:hypothetical protein
MGAQTQRKARPQVGRPNATQGTSASWAPQRTSATQTQGTSARPQVGRPNATQATSAMCGQMQNSSATETSTRPTSWRMDKNKFWLGGRLFNTASPRLGAPTQCKARPQVGRPNTTQGTQVGRNVRNANARHVRSNLGAPTPKRPKKLIRNENVHTTEHLAKRRAGGWIRTNFGLEVDFLIRPHQGWAPQRNERRVHKMGAQTQRKARPQDGRPNEKPIRNENVHTRER